LDALAAAPVNHRLLLENQRVRVLETLVAAGTSTVIHTHRWPSVEYVVSGRHFVRHDGEGSVLFDTRAANAPLRPSDALWAEPFPPHSVKNVGDTELRVIMIELKDTR
jgi:quercetin dioxygenase-like cupin family protein